MASLHYTRFTNFELPSVHLSDSVIAPVLPRAQNRNFSFSSSEMDQAEVSSGQYFGSSNAMESSNAKEYTADVPSTPTTKQPRKERAPSQSSRRIYKKKVEELAAIIAAKKATRRAQLRAGQARYRQRCRDRKQLLLQSVQQLSEEIHGLQLKRERHRIQGTADPGPWSIVSAVFQLIQACFQSPQWAISVDEMKRDSNIRRHLVFLQLFLSPDVAMGKLNGFDALLEQIRRYSVYFGEPNLKLKQMEEINLGIVRVTATLNATITEFTLQKLFPHPVDNAYSDSGERQWLYERLVGQRLSFSCTMSFLFNEDTQLMDRIETNIDFLRPLLQALGSLEMASILYKESLISPECSLRN